MSPDPKNFPLVTHMSAYYVAMNKLHMHDWIEVRNLLSTEKAYDAITALKGYVKATWGLKYAIGEEFDLPRRNVFEEMTEEQHRNETVRINRLLRDQNNLKNHFRRQLEEMMGNVWEDEPLDEEDAAGYLRGEMDFGDNP